MRGKRNLSQERLEQIRANIALINDKGAIFVQVLYQETSTVLEFNSIRDASKQTEWCFRTVKKNIWIVVYLLKDVT